MNQALQKYQQLVKQFDLFGKKVDLNFMNSNKYKTSVGGFITISLLVFLGIFFSRSIGPFLGKENIFVSSYETYSSDPTKITIDPLEMVFAMKMNQDDFIKRPYFNITLQDRFYERFPGGEYEKDKKPVDLVPCTRQHFTQLRSNSEELNWSEKYDFYGFDDYLCPPLNYEFQIGGMFTSDKFYFQKIQVSLCQNSTEVIDDSIEYTSACPPQEEIDEYAASDKASLAILFPNKIINADDTENVVTDFLFDEIFFEIQAGRLFRSANIFFQEVAIQTDQSLWPWEDQQFDYYNIMEPGDFREMVAIGNDVPGEFYFRRSPKNKQFVRKYQKIDDLIAYMGGFVHALLIGGTIVIGYYNEQQYILALANKLYNFTDKDQKAKQKCKNINQQVKKINEKEEEIIKLKQKQELKQQNSITNSKATKKSLQTSQHMNATMIKSIITDRQQVLDKIQDGEGTNRNKKVKTHENEEHENRITFQDDNNTPRYPAVSYNDKNQKNVDKYIVKKTEQNKNPTKSNKMKKKNLKRNIKLYDASLYQGLGFSSRNEFLQNQFEHILKRQSQINMTCKYVLNKMFCGLLFKSDEVKLIEKARLRIRKDLDIFMLVDNVKEIEKLKQVLFDKDQERLFNFFPKPKITVDETNKNEIIRFRDLQQMSKNQQQSQSNNNFSSRYEAQSKQYAKITIREIVIIHKAALKFKQKLDRIRHNHQFGGQTIKGLQQLYKSYDILTKLGNKNPMIDKQNKRLFNLLGDELKTIFETSQLIKIQDINQENPVSSSEISLEQSESTTDQNCNIDQKSKINKADHVINVKTSNYDYSPKKLSGANKVTNVSLNATSSNALISNNNQTQRQLLNQNDQSEAYPSQRDEIQLSVLNQTNIQQEFSKDEENYEDDQSNYIPVEDDNNSVDLKNKIESKKVEQQYKEDFMQSQYNLNNQINSNININQFNNDNDLENNHNEQQNQNNY